MASTRLTRRLAVAALAGLFLGTPPALAAYPVVDAQAIAQLKEQLSAAKKQIETLTQQLETLNQISTTLQEQIDAIGRAGQVSLPMVNIGRLSNQVLRDAQCLMPDFDRLMPDLDMEDVNFDSICAGRNVYDTALFVDPEREGWLDPNGDGYADGATWEAQRAAREAVEARRKALTKDVVTAGLAHADLAASQTAKANEAATEDLEVAVQAATTQNERLAAIAQGQVLTNRQLVQQNQLLAQLVKIQSVMLLQMLPVADRGVGGVE